MLQIAVCDDEIFTCLAIEKQIFNILSDKRVAHSINCFSSGLELIQSMLNFDIVFLDIKMRPPDGIETAKALRNRGCSAILIFVTSSPDYMLNAFDVEAFHYLLKPVDEEKLAKVLFRAVDKSLPVQEDFIMINQGRQIVKLSASKTTYFEINGRVIKAHLPNGIVTFYEQLSVLEQKLPQNKFYRCHKSYLVNLFHIKSFEKTDITLDTGEKLPLSKRRHEDFACAFLSHMKKEGGLL